MNLSDEYVNLSYEEAMKELESIVSRLESGEGTLDESIALFQKGVELSKLCSQRLEEIEKRVRILMDDGNGSKKEADFTETGVSDASEG